jgi:3-hydroxyacyl-CoA dehydrogenase
MKTADVIGLLPIRNKLRDWAAQEPFWTPAPLLDEMIKEGRHFDDMNAD